MVTGFSNLGSPSYLELNMSTENDSVLTRNEIKEMSTKYSKTCAQIILRWGIQRGTAIIPKTTKVDRLSENLEITDFSLTHAEMELINSFNKNKR